jgi:ubiquinol-cytochrome c reductase cytochrome b/c1 subunit
MTTRTLFAAALALGALASAPLAAFAAEGAVEPPRQSWSFSGPFGKFDRGQLQRGFKVYKEVCAACHGLTRLAFRNLGESGGPEFSAAQIKALAATYKLKALDDKGADTERDGLPADRFPPPFPNEAAGRAGNNGALPPDFSVLAKARTYERGFPRFVFDIFTTYQQQGVDYIVALLTGYEEPPAGTKLLDGQHWNKYMSGNLIAMGDPLARFFDKAGKVNADDATFYDDKTPVTRQQMAKDVAAFMMWAAEPHMEARKRTGLQVMAFLLILTGMLYFTKKKVWADVAH